MVRQSDQEGALLLSNVSRPGNRRIRAPNQLGKAVNGRVAFYIGPVLIAEVAIWAFISRVFRRNVGFYRILNDPALALDIV